MCRRGGESGPHRRGDRQGPGGPLPIWSGTGLQHPEAPHLYRVGDWWYLLLAEGGTAHGHSVSIARARSPRGLWEPAPANPFLSARSTDLPIQSTGHADLVTTPDGTWWMVLLATRPRGWFPGFHVLGRETFLPPVEWVDGWPRVGPVLEQHQASSTWHPFQLPPVRDDFDAPTLAHSWISPRSRPDDSWSLARRPGRLVLDARSGPAFFGRRQQHPDCRAAVRIDPGSGRAGLSVRMDEAHRYDIEVAGGVVSVVVRIGSVRQRIVERAVEPGPLTLAVDIGTADAGTRGPDTLTLSVAGPEGAVEPAELDGRYLSTQVAGGFTGRVIGMYVAEGEAAFDWFDYQEALR